jgi:hypothetical protein
MQEMRDEFLKLPRILGKAQSQRRNDDRVGAEPVVEVVAKEPAPAELRQRAIGRRNDAATEAALLPAAHWCERPILQNLQKLDLHRHADVADLIEENRAIRAAAREHPFIRLDGSGEGALR